MNVAARWLRTKDLFRECQLLREGERDAWLAAQCADDAVLLGEVRALLSAQRASYDILDGGAMGVLKRMRIDESAPDLIGQRIGAYRLLRLLGEGGMGSVYLAEREDGDFVQRVALKRVRADFVSAETRARFLRERNFLARLTHPHIAQLHDGGVADDGTPYFTLEYVEGTPITRYCDTHKLDVRGRLRLALQVCAAVTYAHRNLIVHRDLKPSNILVTADGETKLLDFGIAKLVDAEQSHGRTATQSRMMTPEYAAPEQVLGEPITTATDVYAIGVLVYEMLSGRLPYARADAGAVSWAKAVIEEAPESLRGALSRPAPADSVPAAADGPAATRGTTLPALRRRLRGDLDRIVQRALAKEPEARYPSVEALADDLRAVIDDRAISGGSRRYRLRKFVHRHWLPLAATAAILLTLIASGAAVVWQARQTAHEARTTLAVKDFLFGLFTAVDPHEAKGREVSAHELLDRGAQRIERDRSLDNGQRAEIESTLGRIYYQLGLFDQANTLQDHAIRALSENREHALLRLQTEAERADTLVERGDLKTAAALAAEASGNADALAGVSADKRAQLLHTQGHVALAQRDFVAAKRFSDAELALVRDARVAPAVLFNALSMAGSAHWGLSDYDGAEAQFREALAVASHDAAPDDMNVARAQANMGLILQAKSRFAQAQAMYEAVLATYQKVLGPDHPSTLAMHRDLGLSYYHQGLYAQARTTLEQVLAAQRVKFGNEHPALAGTEINLGLVLTDSGDLPAADRVLGEALGIFEKKYGRDYQGATIALGDIAVVHMLRGDLDRAAAELSEVMQRQNKPDAIDPDGFATFYRLGEVKRRLAQAAAAVELERKALIGAQKVRGESSRYTAMAHHLLALSLRDAGDEAGAEHELRAALASYASYIPQAEHPLAATVRYDLALLLLPRAADRAEALRLLTEAVALREKFLGVDDARTQAARAPLNKANASAKA
ncbi:MAG: serine/threonine-protein kinase [Dokdonella sp.]